MLAAFRGADLIMGHVGNQDKVRVAQALLLVVFVLLYIAPLGVRPLGSPDEVRYGAIAHEMLASGDWVSPRFNGVRYFEKPILGHWLNALSLATFGENEFAIRIPVALATGITALMIFSLARRFVSSSAATLAVAIFLTTFLVGGTGTFAVLDALLNAFTTGALATWYLAINEPSKRKRLLYLIGCGIACGGAFLVKGFIGWAVPAIVATAYATAHRQWRTLLIFPWLPIGVAVLVSAPWAILIHMREPDFWNYFFWIEHVKRFAADDAQHAQPPWYYLVYLPVIAWPWVLSWPAALRGIVERIRGDSFTRYLVIWVVLPFVLFSVTRGKLLTYVLPCFPALSILLAAGLDRYLGQFDHRTVRVPMITLAGGFAIALVALLAAQLGLLGNPLYANSEFLNVVALAALLALGLVAALVALWKTRTNLRLVATAIAGVAFILPLQISLPQRVLEEAAPVVTIERYAPARDTLLVSDASTFGTVAWTYKRDDVYVVSPGEIAYGLSYPEDSYRNLKGTMLSDVIAANRGLRSILIICKLETEAAIAAQLPSTVARTFNGSTVFLEIARAP